MSEFLTSTGASLEIGIGTNLTGCMVSRPDGSQLLKFIPTPLNAEATADVRTPRCRPPTLVTDQNGAYAALFLVPGTYELSARVAAAPTLDSRPERVLQGTCKAPGSGRPG